MAILSSDTKIPLKDISYIVAAFLYLGSIREDINALRIKIDGRLELFEYRLNQQEKGGASKQRAALFPFAVTPRSPGLKDEEDGAD